MKSIAKDKVPLVLLLLLVAAALLPNTPVYQEIPGRDSGVFLYTGWRILSGDLPYHDVWARKPPAIYYIDALGLAMSGGSTWGVWVLEFLSLSCAATIGYILLRRAFGTLPAVFGSVAWLATVILLLQGGNLTEEFALPLQFAALYLFFDWERGDGSSWRGYAIGATCVLAFLLRQNLVGVWVAVVLYLTVNRVLSRRWRDLCVHLATMLLGAAALMLIVVGYFAIHDSLGALWDAVFRSSLAFAAAATPETRLAAVQTGLRLTAWSGISIIGLAAWITGLFYVCCATDRATRLSPLLHISLVGLPVEFLLVGVVGRSYAHYYIAWLPILALLAGWFAHALSTGVPRDPISVFKLGRVAPSRVWVVALALAMSSIPAQKLLFQVVGKGDSRDSTRSQVVRYIKDATNEDDYVLMWGYESAINFASHRVSPTRFVHQYPLYLRGYQTTEMIREFLRHIMANNPTVIIDSSPGNEVVPPIDSVQRQKWLSGSDSYAVLPEMDEVFDYISSNYELGGVVGPGQWPVYVYVGDR